MLYITQQIKQQISELAFNAYSDYTLGFLMGLEKREVRIIEKLTLVENSVYGPNQLTISPDIYHNATLLAEENGLSLLGVLIIVPERIKSPLAYQHLLAQSYFSLFTVSVLGDKSLTFHSWRKDAFYQFIEERIVVVASHNYNKILVDFSINLN